MHQNDEKPELATFLQKCHQDKQQSISGSNVQNKDDEGIEVNSPMKP
jgi:hypothetical protein